jgi:hypothetical protein
MIFWLFKITIHFHIYMYYKTNWFVYSIFHLSTLLYSLCWFQYVSNRPVFVLFDQCHFWTISHQKKGNIKL